MMHEQKLCNAPCPIPPIDIEPFDYVPLWHKKIKHCVYSAPSEAALLLDDYFLSLRDNDENLTHSLLN